ncbi:MAG: radical SAM protein [Candidatus Altiarchaeota archaeon]
MKRKLYSPPKRKIFRKGEWYLFYDPINVKWVKVNQAGKEILLTLEKFPFLEDAITKLKNRFQINEDSILQFVENLLNANYLQLERYNIIRINFVKRIYPHSIYLHPTYKCNLECLYCYNSKERKKYLCRNNYTELTLKEYKRLLIDAKEIGVRTLIFTGGEPLVREDLFSIAEFSKSLGFYNSLITNGTLVSPQNAKTLCSLFDNISISIDSYKEIENDEMRGKGTFEKAIKAIKILKNLNGNVSCLGVAHKGNIDSLLDSWDYFVRELGCNSFLPQFLIPNNKNSTTFLSNKNMKMLIKKYGMIRSKINRLNGINQIGLRNSCGMCSGEIAIGADGSVFPCQSLLKEEFCGGNVRQMPLKNILRESLVFKELRNLSVENLEGCSKCEFKYLCGGGCRAVYYGVFKDLKKTFKLFCSCNKRIIVESMWESTAPAKGGLNEAKDKIDGCF